MKQNLWPELIKLVKQHVKPALGCTEPIAVALASAVARSYLKQIPNKIEVELSPNLFKNCMGVIVPGTGIAGAKIAAALGALAGNPDAGLEVLKNISEDAIAQAKQMIANQQINIVIAQDCDKALYVKCTLSTSDNDDMVAVSIADAHTNVIRIEHNHQAIFESDKQSINHHGNMAFGEFTFKDIFDFATNVPFDDIAFILQAKELNNRLSQEGLTNAYAMEIGKTLMSKQESGLLDSSLLSNIIIRSSSAADARMGGAQFPAMSNSGSGNQGIAATMPVVVVAEKFAPNDKDKLARALILSHLSAIYIHLKLPALSAFCAVSSASMGAATAIAWLITGKYDVATKSVTNMIGDVSGVICDGASGSCALKVSTAVAAAYKAVLLAMDNRVVPKSDGFISSDIDETINHLCSIASQGMQETDKLIIQMMYEKNLNQI